MKTVGTLGFFGGLRLIRDVLFTRIFYRQSRIIRIPVYIRGRRFIDLGRGLTTGTNLRIDAFPNFIGAHNQVLKIGDDVEINDYVHIAAVLNIEIGNHVLIASKVFITDHNHGNYSGSDQSHPTECPRDRKLFAKPVKIEENVWIGESATILPGVTIGKGSIVGTSSVVTSDIPPYSIAVGIPARVIKRYNEQLGIWEKV
jgi:acetyltransferase-like isoleucine patch superfamily enzyme